MIVYPTEKIVAGVRLETCLQDESGNPSEYGLERLRELAATRFVVILSPQSQTLVGLKIIYDFLARNDAQYNEVWASPGFPRLDELYDASFEPW